MIMRRFLFIFALSVTACSGSSDEETTTPADAANETRAAADVATSEVSTDTATVADAIDARPAACPCFLGDGPYCAGRAAAEAKKLGCTIANLASWTNDLLSCEDGVWKRLEDCPGACKYTATSTKLDDDCELPVCSCFVKDAYCGSGAGTKAATMGCRVPLLPEHNDDIVACSSTGAWIVKQECALGCQQNPAGVADACKTAAAYKVPFVCGKSVYCSNGNHTSLHDGKDEYAYDFPAPVGTNVYAMRGGTVLRVRNVSKPGDACYNGGGSACANLANTLEIRHSDGTVGLYMHLSTSLVKTGDVIKQGDLVAKSGNSGWSTGPHVHVQLQNNCGIWWCQSVPLKFGEGAIGTGTTVKSQNCP